MSKMFNIKGVRFVKERSIYPFT